ncbi:hypothetical protein [Arenimonas oryziterrae]|uniref:Baseplate protein J-like domain-containing protein n=1 Tax=Arenimonas oryziterrae DSM 21050 = YC6267 TaxID=1121015 RepID=A0A091AUR5_9GAMM|nr:hypothetical protein [Arenimonas oryziterrae]KFN42972.1 hypothetical protein N789_12675 [Arenimonas oryziterrae DSM 21050 = YC6267]
MSCKHDCAKPPLFPKTIFNRPGLPRIDYRIGNYAEVRASMFDALNQQPVLSAFTHRHVDDPAIALLEADAIVVDILSFYQSLYANEAYLRTARWPQSITDLVRLGGYRLTPGLAGEATFALTIKGTLPVTVPAGFGLKVAIEGIAKPVEFETRAALLAHPALSAFSLYRPRMMPSIAAGTRVLRLSGDVSDLKAEDRLLIGEASPGGAHPTQLLTSEIVTIEDTWVAFGKRHVRLTAGLTRATPASALRAYKIGDAVQHFGHNAPTTVSEVSDQGVPSTRKTSYDRRANAASSSEVDPNITAFELPLDRESKVFTAGATVIVQGRFRTSRLSTQSHRLSLVRHLSAVENRSMTWGMLTGASTVLSLHDSLRSMVGSQLMRYADVRSITVLPVLGAALTAHAADVDTSSTQGTALRYFGRRDDAAALSGRRLLLVTPGREPRERHVSAVTSPGADGDIFHDLVLSAAVDYADFGYDENATTVYGNVVDASQGKTLDAAPIGSGDARTSFQSFALPKPPLTYLFDATHTPAQVPALEVRVDGMRWTQVETLFSAGPLDSVYIVREDAEGNSVVQFGDGKTGARPASGRNNIVAVQRVGSGAQGPLQADAKPQATSKLAPLDKVFMPQPVTTGAPPEDPENARDNAPIRLQSLGRLVSLADYEAETRMLPNVLKASARWDAPEGVPAIVLTVLNDSGNAGDLAKVRDALTMYSRCRGPARHPVIALAGFRQYLHVDALVGFDPAYRTEDLLRGIRLALGVLGEEANGLDGRDGLFGLNARDFHQSAHTSQIIAAIQNVAGVSWVQLRAARRLALGTPPEADATQLPLPTTNLIPSPTVACPRHALLALHTRHLVIGFSADQATTECTP